MTKVNFVQIPLPEQVGALKAGRVDAICVGTDLAARAIHDQIGHLLDWVMGAPPFDNFSTGFLVVNREFADRNPIVLENFLKAYITAVKWIADHPDEAKKVTANQLHITDPEIVKAFYLQKWDPTLAPDPQSVTLDNAMMKDQGISQPIDLDKYLTQMKLVADARRRSLANSAIKRASAAAEAPSGAFVAPGVGACISVGVVGVGERHRRSRFYYLPPLM